MLWLVIILTWVLAFTIMPVIVKYASKHKWVRDENYLNAKPRIGGIAIFISFFVGFCLLIYTENLPIDSPVYLSFLTVITIMFGVGLMDDLFGLSPLIKFIFQVIIACIFINEDIAIRNLGGVFDIYELPTLVKWTFNIILISGLINAINSMDSIQGLVGGIAIINSIIYALFFFFFGPHLHWVIALLLLACILSFITYNFYPAKLGIGDGGSLLIGAVITFLAIELYDIQRPNLAYHGFYNIIPLLYASLIIPVYDMIRVIFVRFNYKKSIFKGDRSHFNHLLKYSSNDEGNLAFRIYIIHLVIVLFGLLFSVMKVYLPISIAIITIITYLLYEYYAIFGHITIYLKKKFRKH